ncbi:unnamed protein product [Caenorhabditis auriculariae]|uniref:Saposin B-type domain-containing protein n=1 Tax=Caenorhabditis auriculariae TaxID=2777116 RepID=A0A8S1H999_9PELO|nr:unnamed protein product [Caenorhabditis auriculariae]
MKTLLCLFALIAVSTALVLPPLKTSAIGCLMCEIVVKVAEDPADRDAHVVENKFDAECKATFKHLPFVDKECEAYGNSKIDPIIKELEGGTAPQDVCTKLKEC